MRRLEKNGIVLGYSVKTADVDRLSKVQAYMMLRVQGKAANTVLRVLKGYPEATSLHVTNGRWDIAIGLAVRDLAELEQTLRRVRAIEGVLHTETSILLSQQK